MTNKAYIVANEQQEREVLGKLEREGYVWIDHTNKPTEFVPSIEVSKQFPYAIVVDMNISLKLSNYFEHYEIVFDGRKEEKISEKYVVSQVFMNELKGWKHDLILEDAFFVNQEAINNMPKIIKNWWDDDYVTIGESNKRLISIIRYMSGANDFEVEKPKKWVVRSKDADTLGRYGYLDCYDYAITENTYKPYHATKFDTKEEAQEWANSHQEVIEVDG